jgi:hypothetical protein
MVRLPSPLIEPNVPISGIRLSDWIHCMSFGSSVHAGVFSGNGSKFRLCLSLAIELSLKDPDLFRCFQAHRQSPNPLSLSLQKRTRSQGPSLLRSYPDSSVLFPCPTPAAAQCRRSRSPPSPRRVSPVARITFRTCRAHYPGGPSGCICRFFPVRMAFPVKRAGRRPRFPFRGLLRLYSHYGPPGCSTAFTAAFVTRLRHGRLPDRTARQLPDRSTSYLGGFCLQLVIRAFGAHL